MRLHSFLLRFPFLVRSPKRKPPLMDSGWDCDATQSVLSSLGCSQTAVTVACIAWDPSHLSHAMCLAIHLSADTIISSHNSSFVLTADVEYLLRDWSKLNLENSCDDIALDGEPPFHFTCELFKNRQMSAPEDRPSSLCTNETYSSFCSQTQSSSWEIKFHAKLMTLHARR